MIQSFFIGIALLASFFGLLRTPTPIWDSPSLQFGATSFPTSLDSLTNPSGTDSVATVSHSGQHSNANDAIEALEAKLGIGASTALSGTILAGNGTGSSIWTTYATGTSAYFTNYLATGSSTLQNFTFRTATGTSATTTNFFSTDVVSTTASTTNFYGADLTGCSSNNVLTWLSGKFGCETDDTGGATIVSTTTTANMSSTTVAVAAFNTIRFWVQIPQISGSGATTSAAIDLHFNGDSAGTNYAYMYSSDGGAYSSGSVSDINFIRLAGSNPDNRPGRYISGSFTNITGQDKIGRYSSVVFATSTGPYLGTTENKLYTPADGFFLFTASANPRITTFEVGTSIPDTFMATGTVITIEASN